MAISCVIIPAAVFLFCASLGTSSGADNNGCIRVAILGVTGVGRSSLANSITGSNEFRVGGGSKSITKNFKSARITRNGLDLNIIDTPEIFKTLQDQIIQFLEMTSPGPNIILYAIQAARYTSQDVEGLHTFLDMFDEGILSYTIIVFTHLTCSEKDYIRNLKPVLRDIIDKCNSRYIFMPSPLRKSETESRTKELLRLMNNLVTTNNNSYYSNNNVLMYTYQRKNKQEEQEAVRRAEQGKKWLEEAKTKVLWKALENDILERLQQERDIQEQKNETRRLKKELMELYQRNQEEETRLIQEFVLAKQEAKRHEERKKKEEEQRRVEAEEKARVEAKKKELQKVAEKAEQERLQLERDRQAAAARAEAQRRETERKEIMGRLIISGT